MRGGAHGRGWVIASLCVLMSIACDERASSEPAAPVEMPSPRAGGELVGTEALPFAADLQWLDGEARSLAELRGKAVFVRFWTDTCPFCEASAPGLTRLHQRYADRGLVVLGMFHPKPRGSITDLGAIRDRASELGLRFPIASDARWDTLERWWLATGTDRAATSVSFLIDREGVVRWVHPGPELHPDGPADHEQCRRDFADAERAIELVLAEPAGPSGKAPAASSNLG